MGGDARIRWISNNGLEMVRKPVKTAVKRHGGGHKEEGMDAPIARTSERTTAVEARGPATIVEGTATVALSRGARAYTSAFGGSIGISQRCKDPSFDGFRRVLLRASEDR
jgi:hypothetical protein